MPSPGSPSRATYSPCSTKESTNFELETLMLIDAIINVKYSNYQNIRLNEWNNALMNNTLSIFSDNSLHEFQCHNNCAKLHFCRSLQTQSSCLDECQTDIGVQQNHVHECCLFGIFQVGKN